MSGLVTLLLIWGIVAVALVGGMVGVALHIRDETSKGHRAALVYGPLVLAVIAPFGVWVIRSWIFNWGN